MEKVGFRINALIWSFMCLCDRFGWIKLKAAILRKRIVRMYENGKYVRNVNFKYSIDYRRK